MDVFETENTLRRRLQDISETACGCGLLLEPADPAKLDPAKLTAWLSEARALLARLNGLHDQVAAVVADALRTHR